MNRSQTLRRTPSATLSRENPGRPSISWAHPRHRLAEVRTRVDLVRPFRVRFMTCRGADDVEAAPEVFVVPLSMSRGWDSFNRHRQVFSREGHDVSRLSGESGSGEGRREGYR